MLQLKKQEKRDLLQMFIFGAVVGFVLEFVLGWTIYILTGNFWWIYPESNLVTTSLLVIPVWGIAGIIFVFIWKFVKKHEIFKD